MSKLLADLLANSKFSSIGEFDRFERELNELIREGAVEEIAAVKNRNRIGLERLFRDKRTSDVFRFAPPEFPSRGLWERVKKGH